MLALAQILWGMAAASTADFATCDGLVADDPAAYESYRCYYEVAASTADWQGASARLGELALQHPTSDWLVFVRGLVAGPVDDTRAEAYFRKAAAGFRRSGNDRGELLARANLQTRLFSSGRMASAARQVQRVGAIGAVATDPELKAQARIIEAQFLILTGTDLNRARSILEEAEADADASYRVRQHVLHGLGSVAMLTGRYDDALGYLDRLRQQAAANADLPTIARARAEGVNVLVEQRAERPADVDPAQLNAAAGEALAASRLAGDEELELSSLRVLGEVLLTEDEGAATHHVDACIDLARQRDRQRVLGECLWLRARLLADSDPEASLRVMDQAIGLTQHEQGDDYRALAFAWRHAMRIAWQTQPPQLALGTSLQGLDAIEQRRRLQPGLQGRAAVFSAWSRDYHWLSGQLLAVAANVADTPDTAGLRQWLRREAFIVSERMRARSLLDQLSAPSATLIDMGEPNLARHTEVMQEIVSINRRLLATPTTEQTRTLRQRLVELEREDAALRETQAPPAASTQVTLQALQTALAPEEAMLAFQIGEPRADGGAGGGGSWVFAVTSDQVQVFELPERQQVEASLAMYRSLVTSASPLLPRASAALYDRLLRPAVDGLPARITRLVVVPDAPLAVSPLAALGAAGPDSALIDDFELVLAPSATIWAQWRASGAETGDRRILVLADPVLDTITDALPLLQPGIAADGLQALGALPYARAEGEDIARHLSGRTELWAGAEASEAHLKAAPFDRLGVLHFAAHALVDSENPERSAILLASGSTAEDGLLQSREIANLALAGQLVVLSSCQSATGSEVRGEGVLGLARAFFSGGARVVIGSLWPIRDDHGRAFFEPFYRALGEGATVGAAFRSAQRNVRERGLPAELWAGFVLMGDPDVAVVRRKRIHLGLWPWLTAAGATLVLLGFLAWRYLTRRA